ncbi:MAG: GNAT family N-acetyltransferase [Bryobacteraceae bacterium]
MTRHAETPTGHIEVIPAAPDQELTLANLLQLYIHDFSEFHHLELEADGRFGYEHLPLYWLEPNRHPFLLKINGELAGLVFVKKASAVSSEGTVWEVAEFFIVHGYRRRGIGTAVAHEVWRRFPGLWQVRVMESNHAAHQFWERAISAFAGEAIHSVRVEKDGERWRVFSFESKCVP